MHRLLECECVVTLPWRVAARRPTTAGYNWIMPMMNVMNRPVHVNAAKMGVAGTCCWRDCVLLQRMRKTAWLTPYYNDLCTFTNKKTEPCYLSVFVCCINVEISRIPSEVTKISLKKVGVSFGPHVETTKLSDMSKWTVNLLTIITNIRDQILFPGGDDFWHSSYDEVLL